MSRARDPRRALRPLVVVTLLAMSACFGADTDTRVPVQVFAASSLAEGMQALEQAFEQAHPRIDLRLSFAGSQVLRVQIEQGARADIYASANEAHVRALADAGLVAKPEVFAGNQLAIIVPLDNPAAIESFEDLAHARRLVVGAPSVPIGLYTRELFEHAKRAYGEEHAAQLEAAVVSRESNVRLVRAKVELGEADAAVVYATDAQASKQVRTISIPAALNVEARYFIAAVEPSKHGEEVAAFLAFVGSPRARELLEDHGFTREVR